MSYNPMSVNDYDAILWLEEESKNNPELMNAWKILKAYYEECKKELKNIDKSSSPFESVNEKEHVHSFAEEVSQNEIFMEECVSFLDYQKMKLIIFFLRKN